jgi:hypothetical protein
MTVSPGNASRVEKMLDGIKWAKIGVVVATPQLKIKLSPGLEIKLNIEDLLTGYKETLSDI